LVGADLDAVVAVLRPALHAEHVTDFELVFCALGLLVPQRQPDAAGLVGDVDVHHAALGVLVVILALERPHVADAGHLRDELHLVHLRLHVGDAVDLAVLELVGDEHGGRLLVGQSAHLFDLRLDGVPELLEGHVGVEVPVDVLDVVAHNRSSLQTRAAHKRCPCRITPSPSVDCRWHECRWRAIRVESVARRLDPES